MKIKNVSTSNLQIPEIKDSQGAGLMLSPGAEVIIYDEDAEKSPTLASYITAGYVTKTGTEEPGDSSATADVDVVALRATVAVSVLTVAGLEADLVALTETVAAMQETIDNLISRIEELESS